MSPIDSPRESCSSSPRRTIGVAPSSATPTSKEIRVRVEGFSKTRPMLRPASDLGSRRRAAPAGFQLERPVEQLAELERAQLFAGEEVLLQAGNTKRVPRLDRDRLEPLPRARLPARPGPASPGARGCCGSPSATRPTCRSTASCSTSSPRPRRRRAGTSPCSRRARRASPAPLAQRLRRRGATGC